ncbi:MAG: hypothetical protein JXO51_07285, partial [Candidatus Aminicenantes bacterium]|nr:hypothetical protein [Candidatus Aminicenantes bacterium]
MRKRISWLAVLAVIAMAGLLAGSGVTTLAAEEGWCCKDGVVFAATPEQCKEKGGVWFPTKAEAEKYCEAPPSGWCCVDKVVIPATPEECKEKGGVWFPTKAEAEKYCEAPPSGW